MEHEKIPNLEPENGLDDDREVELDDGEELVVPPTIDPDERVEVADDDPEVIHGEGPLNP